MSRASLRTTRHDGSEDERDVNKWNAHLSEERQTEKYRRMIQAGVFVVVVVREVGWLGETVVVMWWWWLRGLVG